MRRLLNIVLWAVGLIFLFVVVLPVLVIGYFWSDIGNFLNEILSML